MGLSRERQEGRQSTSDRIAAWSEVVRAMPAPTALLDATGHVLAASRWVEVRTGERLIDVADPDQTVFRSVDGESRWRARPLRIDGSVLLATRERFGAGDHLLRRFFASGDSLYVVYDQQGRIVEWNDAWARILGYSDDEIFGLDSWSLLPSEDQDMRAVVEKDLREHGRSEPSWRMQAADGSFRVVQWVLHYDTAVGRCFGVGRDVSDDARRRDELHRRAYTDDLTGLANRARTIAELDRHLRGGGQPSVLFCDLDRFKMVNDSLGHAAGDRLLALLGRRLSNLFANSDCMVGRLGGDEFAVVVGGGGEPAAQRAAELVYEAVEPSFALGGRSVQLGVSIGVRVADPDDVEHAEAMFEDADMAVYRAKERGRQRTEVFGPELKLAVQRRFELEGELRAGLSCNAFEPWYQPIVCLETERIVGVEALMRWRSDGLVRTPGDFLDVAIESGLIGEIGRQVMRRTFAEFGALSRADDLFVTVNVSAREFADHDLASWLLAEVGRSPLRPDQVVVEITESVAIEGEALKSQLVRLREAGVRVALDDFGTGHSSLAHLRTLPIDLIKIDRSFVADLVADDTTRALTRSVVDLCRALGLMVVFEGVETHHESAAVSASLGEYVQGYLYHRPMPIDALAGVVGSDGHAAREVVSST